MDKDKILNVAISCLDNFLRYREPRLKKIKEYEDAYFGKVKKTITERFNIPIPIIEGFVNTLESKIDDSVQIVFKAGKPSSIITAKKITALYEKDSAQDRGNYNSADLDAKKLAIFSGFGVLKLIPSSNPYRQDLKAVDYYDFVFDPYAGVDLENHNFVGEINIIKSETDLINGIKNGIYDKKETEELLSGASESVNENDRKELYQKMQRYEGLGLVSEFNRINYGEKFFSLVEMYLKYKGEKYYILFSPIYKKVLRIKKITDLFSNGLTPYIAWHFERNPSNFFCKSPLDSVYPIAEAMRILINQNFDNIQKRNWGMIVYNANKIDNPVEFTFRPNGLIRARLDYGESLENAFSQIQTPDITSITIDLLSFFDSFIGMKTGITPSTQGVSEEDKVGIYYGNLEQVSDRFNLLNKFYREAYVKIGIRYLNNLKDYLPNKYEIKMLGEEGYIDDFILKSELDDEFSIDVISSSLESKQFKLINAKKTENIFLILKDPELRNSVNKKWLLKNILSLSNFSDSEIKEALDLEQEANDEILVSASRAIEDILSGKKPKLNRRANTAFIRKIIYYAHDNVDDDELYAKLLNYAIEHIPIAERNAMFLSNLVNREANQGVPQQVPQQNYQPMENEENPMIYK